MNDVRERRRPRSFAKAAVLLFVLLAVVGGALGYALGARAAGQVTSRATVLVSPLGGNPYSPDGSGDDLVNLETEAQLVNSDAVARKVATALGAPNTSGLLSGLNVTVPPNTQILVIEYEAGTTADADARTQAFAEGYLEFRTDRADSVVSTRAGRIQDEIKTETRRLDGLVLRQATVPSTTRAVLQQQINGATAAIGQLRTQLIDVQTGEVDPGQIITPAHVISRDPVITKTVFTLGGEALGLAAATLIVVLRSRARALGEVRDADEVEQTDGADEPDDRPDEPHSWSANGLATAPANGSVADPAPATASGSSLVDVPARR